MRTVLDIADRLYAIINIASVKATINGLIYKAGQPEQIANVGTTQNIIINMLTSLNTPVGNSIANINIYVPDISNGVPNDAKMKTIATAVIGVLEAYTSNTDHFFIDMDSMTNRIIRDENNLSFLNLRFEVLTD